VPLRFGTDGVRGVANVELTPEFGLALGRAAAQVLFPSDSKVGPGGTEVSGTSAGRRCVVVGRDTRRSGSLLQAALSSGFAGEGIDVIDLGVLPTPAVAAVAQDRGVPGAVISASHNPFSDNGIKLFGVGGRKLLPAVEAALEAALDALLETPGAHAGHPVGPQVGVLEPDPAALGWYCQQVVAALEGRRLEGLRVILDAGNGAAAFTALRIFTAAGAEVVGCIGVEPDGTNINDGCGSTDPRRLAAAVVAQQADVGLAFDGDADRVIAVDDHGEVVDGDRLLALFATDLAQRDKLAGDTLVVTVMSNLGLHRAMEAAGIEVHTTGVGDRAVLEALEAHGWSLGGEQSGHLVFRDLATTGDGVLSGLLLCDLVLRRNVPLGVLAAAAMERLPQVLRNVAVADRDGLADTTGGRWAPVWEAVAAEEALLGAAGRVLLRPSGTEPLVRVMVEAPTHQAAQSATDRVAAAVEAALAWPRSDDHCQ